ncbi:MAG: hypothetical protein O7F76_02110 [Planctomycetota bacterium]|nr:hypothetical protein [Planctomycetota bacterium]
MVANFTHAPAAANPSCGRAAGELLRELIDGQEVDCRSLGRDRYKRMIAKCSVGWLDLGAEMVTRDMVPTPDPCLRRISGP